MKKRNKKVKGVKKKSTPIITTGGDLQALLNLGEVQIGLETYYNIYTKNTDLRAGIRKIASKIGVKGFIFENDNGKPVNRPQLQKAIKRIFTDPERGIKNFASFKREVLKDLYIAGEVYIIPIFNGLGQLLNFQILDPRTITKIYNLEGQITKFRQRNGKGSYKDFEPDKIYFYKLENDPRSPVNGLSLLHSVVWDVLTDTKATERNFYFFENDKVPRSILQLSEDYDYTDPETQLALEKLKESLNGTDKAHKTITSNLVKDVKILEMTNQDMEFVNQRKLTTDKVGALLGIPKTELGYSENINYATAKQFYATFIDGTIKPLQEEFNFLLTDLLHHFTTSFDGLNIRLITDDTVDIYEEHKDQRLDVASGILDINEVREARGLEPKETEKEEEKEE